MTNQRFIHSQDDNTRKWGVWDDQRDCWAEMDGHDPLWPSMTRDRAHELASWMNDHQEEL